MKSNALAETYSLDSFVILCGSIGENRIPVTGLCSTYTALALLLYLTKSNTQLSKKITNN